MPELTACLERQGFTKVSTYIQSGNAVFESEFKDAERISAMIEEAVAKEFGCSPMVVVISDAQLARVVQTAPRQFGESPDDYRYDVMFIKPPLCARDVLPTIQLRTGVDEASEANGVFYFRRLKDAASRSYLPKIIQNAAYSSMTIRTWNTTRELLRLVGYAP